MIRDERDIACDIVEVGRRLYARGLIGGGEGNVSVRQGDTLHVTPAGVCKGFLTPDAIVKTDMEGRPLRGGRASTEILMHTAVYRRRADVRAVVHAHPPMATAFAVAGLALDRPLIAEAVVTLGPVPVIPYGQPSTEDLARNVGDAICSAHALLMANHGAIAVGDSLYRAWERMETLEQLARVSLYARLLGGDSLLPRGEVDRLLAAREGSGYPAPACDPAAPPRPFQSGPAPAEGDRITLSRAELEGLIADAVRRLGRA
jgi:L-fuculose-phosphate aldolase